MHKIATASTVFYSSNPKNSHSSTTINPSLNGSVYTPFPEKITGSEIIELCSNTGSAVPLIKALRSVSNMGLKDAKDAITRHQLASGLFDIDGVFEEFVGASTYVDKLEDATLTKTQFIGLIEEAIDKCDVYFLDPLEAVLLLCNNIKAQGGLKTIGGKLNKIVDKLSN